MDGTELPPSKSGTKHRERARPWTEEEQQKLFRDYFDRLPGICPVCASEVHMMMEHKGDVTALVMRCGGCSNSAVVSKKLNG